MADGASIGQRAYDVPHGRKHGDQTRRRPSAAPRTSRAVGRHAGRLIGRRRVALTALAGPQGRGGSSRFDMRGCAERLSTRRRTRTRTRRRPCLCDCDIIFVPCLPTGRRRLSRGGRRRRRALLRLLQASSYTGGGGLAGVDDMRRGRSQGRPGPRRAIISQLGVAELASATSRRAASPYRRGRSARGHRVITTSQAAQVPAQPRPRDVACPALVQRCP